MNRICNRIILLFMILSVSLPAKSQAQTPFSLSFETGITISQFPLKNIIEESWGETRTTWTYPLAGPLAGISHEFTFSKHIRFITGLNYQMSGQQSYSYTEFTATPTFYKEWRTLKMHKLAIPVFFGYQFRIGKVSPSVSLGFRPNYIFSGMLKDEFHETFFYEDGHSDLIDYDNGQKLMENNSYYTHPKRVINQYCVGLYLSFKKRYKACLTYNIGHNEYTNVYISRGNHATSTWTETTEIPASDIILSFQYSFCILKCKPVAN